MYAAEDTAKLCDMEQCPTLQDEQRLQNDLMSGYNKNLRPTKDRTLPTIVSVAFYLLQIKGYDAKTRSFSFSGVFGFEWISQNMVWNKTQYGGIEYTIFPQSDVWLPQLLPGNAHTEIKPLGSGGDLNDIPVRVYHNGYSTWSTGGMYEHACPGDITYYPFDYQTCEIQNFPWFYGKNELLLYPAFGDVAFIYLKPNGLWDVVDSKVEVTDFDYRQQFLVTITIKRYPTYYVINIIVPVIVISLLNILVFLIPASAGERVSFAVTMLLAMSVFLTIVSDNLPETSQPSLPLLSYFLFADLLISTFVTFSTVIGLRYHHMDKDAHMPVFYRRFAQLYTRCCKKSKHNQTSSFKYNTGTHKNNSYFHTTSNQQRSFQGPPIETYTIAPNTLSGTCKLPRIILNEQYDGHSNDSSVTENSCCVVTWYEYACFFDMISFIWYSLLLFTKNIILISVMLVHTSRIS